GHAAPLDAEIGQRVGERPAAAPPLGDADYLAAALDDLPRGDTGEADESGPPRRERRPSMHLEVGEAQRLGPPRPDPGPRPGDVVAPQRISPRHPCVGPNRSPRLEQHRPAAAAPADELDALADQR